MSSYDYAFHLIIVGDAGVGKSSLLFRFKNRGLQPPPQNFTIGVDFCACTINIGGKAILLSIWETAGEEAFTSISISYYRGAAGSLLVRETFDRLATWLKDARQYANEDMPIMLIGNKCDLSRSRAVSKEEGEQFARTHGLLFLETSVMTDQNIEQTAAKILPNIKEGVSDVHSQRSGIKLGHGTRGKSGAKKSGCYLS